MLIHGDRLIDAPVMSLQTGSEIARTKKPIINPDNLAIVAYELTGPLLDRDNSLLRIEDVREFSDIGLIVNSSDEFVSPDDVIKLGEIYKLHFDPVGMPVIDKKNRKLGKVNGYTINVGNFMIEQLNVKRPLLKSLNESELLVHRSQIREINNRAIVVDSETEAKSEPLIERVNVPYVNPFRNREPDGPSTPD